MRLYRDSWRRQGKGTRRRDFIIWLPHTRPCDVYSPFFLVAAHVQARLSVPAPDSCCATPHRHCVSFVELLDAAQCKPGTRRLRRVSPLVDRRCCPNAAQSVAQCGPPWLRVTHLA